MSGRRLETPLKKAELHPLRRKRFGNRKIEVVGVRIEGSISLTSGMFLPARTSQSPLVSPHMSPPKT